MNEDTQFTFADSVWDSCSEKKKEAALVKLKAQMAYVIRNIITTNGWNVNQTAKSLGLSQHRTRNLINGEISKFSLDALYKIMVACQVTLNLKTSDKSDFSCDVIMSRELSMHRGWLQLEDDW